MAFAWRWLKNNMSSTSRSSFAFYLKETWEKAYDQYIAAKYPKPAKKDDVQTIKKMICQLGDRNSNSIQQIIWEMIGKVAMGNFGFATEIANTVTKYGRCSEKQAYHIAVAYCK